MPSLHLLCKKEWSLQKYLILVTWIWRTKTHQSNNRSQRETVTHQMGRSTLHAVNVMQEAGSIVSIWYDTQELRFQESDFGQHQ
jgi:hypothetical protein